MSRTAEGVVHVTTDICPHGHCSIGKGGTVRDGTLICPCHGSVFSAVDGSVVQGPAPTPLAPVNISVNGSSITITG